MPDTNFRSVIYRILILKLDFLSFSWRNLHLNTKIPHNSAHRHRRNFEEAPTCSWNNSSSKYGHPKAVNSNTSRGLAKNLQWSPSFSASGRCHATWLYIDRERGRWSQTLSRSTRICSGSTGWIVMNHISLERAGNKVCNGARTKIVRVASAEISRWKVELGELTLCVIV